MVQAWLWRPLHGAARSWPIADFSTEASKIDSGRIQNNQAEMGALVALILEAYIPLTKVENSLWT
jgi:hypothetical protein